MGVTGRDWGVMVWTSSLRSGAWEKLERLWWAGEGGQGVTLTPWRVPEAQSQGGCRGSIWIEQMSLPGDCVCQALGVGNGGLLASGKIIPNPGHGRAFSPLPPSGSVATSGYHLDPFLIPHFSARQFTYFYYNENCTSLPRMKSQCHLP